MKPVLLGLAAVFCSPVLVKAAIVSTTSPGPWSAVFVPTSQINQNFGTPVTTTVGSYFYGSPWDGSGVASFATQAVNLGGLGITDGSAPTPTSWISVNYGGQGLGNANNGYVVFSTELDVHGSAGDAVDYRFAFSGDNRVMNVSVTDGYDTFSLYNYAAPAVAPSGDDEFYRGFTSTIIGTPGSFMLNRDFSTLRLQVELFNEQNLASSGPNSPTGLIFAGSFENAGPTGSTPGVPESGYMAPLSVALLALGRVRRAGG